MILQVSPILLVLSLILAFRRPPVQAAMAGAFMALALWVAGTASPVSPVTAVAIGIDTLVLFAMVAFVISPGLLFVLLIEKAGANIALTSWVRNTGLSGAPQILFIVLGLAPLLEAMTGFGVSLIVTVPLLVTLLDQERGSRVAFAGMVIMPWGTLGLATVVGAALAGLSASELAAFSAWTSAPVFILLSLMGVVVSGRASAGGLALALLSSSVFVGVLQVASSILGPAPAGVIAGTTVTALYLIGARALGGPAVLPPAAAWPYAALLASVLALEAFGAAGDVVDQLVVRGEAISWKPLTSPGIALLLVGTLLLVRLGAKGIVGPLLQRARRPLMTVLFFLLMSQTLVKAGFLDGVTALRSMDAVALAPLVAGIGGLAGYLTGSNLAGNVIVMPHIALLALEPESLAVLAAVQNSAAGHAALGSLPLVALVLALAKGLRQEEEERLVRFAVALVLMNMAAVGIMGFLLLAF